MDDSLVKVLACPDCKGSLEKINGKLKCVECGRVFEVKGGIPILLPKNQ